MKITGPFRSFEGIDFCGELYFQLFMCCISPENTMLTDSTFSKDFAKNSRIFHQIQVYFQTLNFQNKIPDVFKVSRMRGNPDNRQSLLVCHTFHCTVNLMSE